MVVPKTGELGNWAEMDSDVLQIILTLGAGALLVWKEMYRNAHAMREISFAFSVLTIFSSQGKKKVLTLMYEKTEMTGERDNCS